MKNPEHQTILEAVRKDYAFVAKAEQCAGATPCCCNSVNSNADSMSIEMGYSKNDINAVPAGANLGLGCGNPKAIAALKDGEVVLDLGSGAGFDCFLAAAEVGQFGQVIGVDMTPEMISKARTNVSKFSGKNIEFRLGEIEHLPVADNSVDVIISNCVINLSPEKTKVFKEAYRVLKAGGRLAISDVVTAVELPEKVKNDIGKYTACIAGASDINALERILKGVGFTDIRISPKDNSKQFIKKWAPEMNITDFIISANIEAIKS